MGTLVLNSSYQPLGAVTETDGVILVATKKAVAILEDDDRIYRSNHLSVKAPKVVVLNHYQKMRSFKIRPAALTNAALFKRDNHTCQYCGIRKDNLKGRKKLTRDHILPISRGGTNTWDNVTTACSDCNYRKDDKTPEEARMKLLSQPTIVVTWTIRGKSKLTQEQIEFIEKIMNLKPA